MIAMNKPIVLTPMVLSVVFVKRVSSMPFTTIFLVLVIRKYTF